MVHLNERTADDMSGSLRVLSVLLECFDDVARRGRGGHITSFVAPLREAEEFQSEEAWRAKGSTPARALCDGGGVAKACCSTSFRGGS